MPTNCLSVFDHFVKLVLKGLKMKVLWKDHHWLIRLEEEELIQYYFAQFFKQLIFSRLKVKECWHHLLYVDVISVFVIRKCQKIRRIDEIVNIDGKNLNFVWMTWVTSVKFSGQLWLMAILKVTRNQGFTLSLE